MSKNPKETLESAMRKGNIVKMETLIGSTYETKMGLVVDGGLYLKIFLTRDNFETTPGEAFKVLIVEEYRDGSLCLNEMLSDGIPFHGQE